MKPAPKFLYVAAGAYLAACIGAGWFAVELTLWLSR